MAAHEIKKPASTSTLRALYPEASIIRQHFGGSATVFDKTEDAVGHWSATKQQSDLENRPAY